MGAIFVCWPVYDVSTLWLQWSKQQEIHKQHLVQCGNNSDACMKAAHISRHNTKWYGLCPQPLSCVFWLNRWVNQNDKMQVKTARKWISLIISKQLINGRVGNKGSLGLLGTVPLMTCCLLRLWQYNRRCSNKSCVACNSIIIADWLFSVEMLRLESEQPQSHSCWKHTFVTRHWFDIQLYFFFSSFPHRSHVGMQKKKVLPLRKMALSYYIIRIIIKDRAALASLRSIHHIK